MDLPADAAEVIHNFRADQAGGSGNKKSFSSGGPQITSAKLRSVRRKYFTPNQTNSVVMPDRESECFGSSGVVPRKIHASEIHR